jgi:hypothetical protein
MKIVTIDSGVSSIGEYAFYDCASLTNITIPNSVTSIGDGAFENCDDLTSVIIPDSVTSIANLTFDYCISLTNITISDSVTSIGDGAFEYCFNLTSVIIPKSMTSIEGWAFAYCSSLTQIYFQGNAPSLGNAVVFVQDLSLTNVYYLPGTTGWAEFLAITGRSGALWFLPNPTILNFEPNFGVQKNNFGFTLSWATNTSVVVEACTNLSNPNWQPVQTNTLTTGSAYFSDSQWTNYPSRYYRLRSP